jgi:predicted AAA+ superfamily ATPase
MRRRAIEILRKWKANSEKKPMIMRGARQVGKTWLMKEFGKTEYKNVAYVNFDGNPRMENLFSLDMSIPRILEGLQIETSQKIAENDTLIIFDEIQECPKALTALKYFYEQFPQYHIIAAGSMLGVALHKGVHFPVGKVEFMDLHPMTFEEFLSANGEDDLLNLLENFESENVKVFKDRYHTLLKQYYYVGGMPEAVKTYAGNRDYKRVRAIQNAILGAYKEDFSKHIPTTVKLKIDMLWDSIPVQITQERKKFLYKNVKHGARAAEFEEAIAWLMGCGLVHKINRVTKPGLPLKAYEDPAAFKLFILDIGLLSAMAGLPEKTLLEGDKIFMEFHGALAEQYVLQQLKASSDASIFYWMSKSHAAELDFLIQLEGHIIPVEVKAATNLQAKSLKFYRNEFQPEKAVRMSMADYKIDGGLYNIPLYMAGKTEDILLKTWRMSQNAS